MKIAIICDTHWGYAGKEVYLDYFGRFFDDVFFPKIKDEGVTHLIHLGDLTDQRRGINYLALSVMKKKFIQPIADMGINTYILAGNHDVYYKNTNRINSLQELFGHGEYPNIRFVWDKAETIEIGGLKIDLCPWLNPENMDKNLSYLKNSDSDLLMGHFEFEGFDMGGGRLCTHGLSPKTFPHRKVFSGHFHTPSTRGRIRYLGAPYEMTWADCDGSRGFHILHTDTKTVDTHLNPLKLFKKVSLDEDVTLNDVEKLDLGGRFDRMYVKINSRASRSVTDAALSKISDSGKAIDVKVSEMLSESVSDDLDIDTSDTETLIRNYVKSASVNCDREWLEMMMVNLYRESEI